MTEKNLTKEQKTALGKMMADAFSNGDLAVVEGCLRQGVDLSHAVEWYNASGYYKGNRPILHWAAYIAWDKKILAAVIAAAPDINLRASNGDNVLFSAIEASNEVAAAMFTAAGADILAQNKEGEVALEKARKIGSASSRKAVVDAMLADYSTQQKTAPKPAPAQENPPPPPPVSLPPRGKNSRKNDFTL